MYIYIYIYIFIQSVFIVFIVDNKYDIEDKTQNNLKTNETLIYTGRVLTYNLMRESVSKITL